MQFCIFKKIESETSIGTIIRSVPTYCTITTSYMDNDRALREFFSFPGESTGDVDGPHIFAAMHDMVNDLTHSAEDDDHACQLLLDAIPLGPKKVRGVLKRAHPHMPELVLNMIAGYMCRSDYVFCVDVDAMARRHTPTFVDTVPKHHVYISKCRGHMRSMGAYESARKERAKLYENADRLMISRLKVRFAKSSGGIHQRAIKEALRVSPSETYSATL